MQYSVNLDDSSRQCINMKLYENVQNVQELRAKLLNGQLKCCIIKPALICDPFQVVVAANKAVTAEKTVTKSVFTEILYNLSISKNITQSLQKFGVEDSDENLLVVTLNLKDENVDFEEIFNEIRGQELDITELGCLADVGLIKRAYKISEKEFKDTVLLDSVVSRIATKDLL